MWTFEITYRSIENGELRVDVLFTNGALSFSRTYFPQDLDSLKRAISVQIDAVTKKETFLSSVVIGKTFDLTLSDAKDDTPVVVVGPAPGEHI